MPVSSKSVTVAVPDPDTVYYYKVAARDSNVTPGNSMVVDTYRNLYAVAPDQVSRLKIPAEMTGVVLPSGNPSGRSIFFIDIAMPRDIEESVNDLDGVYLYRLEDFEAIVAKNMAGRAESVAAARAIVEAKAAEFDLWAKSLSCEKELSLRHSERPAR